MWLANLFDQAVQSQQRGDLAEAERLYRQLIKLAPHEDAARILLAEIKQQHEGEEALQILDTVRDKNATFWAKRGKVLGILGREDEAEVAYKRALKMDPRSPHAFFNRGFLRLSSGKYIEALGDYDAGLAIVPTYADGHNNRGWCLLNVGRFEEASRAFEQALLINPGLAGARYNQGLLHLLRGDFSKGLPLYEYRKTLARPVEGRRYPQPLWTGREDISGRHVFVYVEQGLGDTIQFFRFIDDLLDRKAEVTLAAAKPLLALLATAQRPIRLIDLNTDPGSFDLHIPLMSLPLALGVGPDTIPRPIAFRPDGERVSRWASMVGHGFKIGISWQGVLAGGSADKNIPLAFFEGLAEIPGVSLFSLQKLGTENMPGWLKAFADLDCEAAFLDSAAVMNSLDLVITADTAIAHLAGTQGMPVWIALKYAPDWRWLQDRADSPWYPTARLFRQQRYGEWSSVMRDIGQAVRDQCGLVSDPAPSA